MKQDFLHIAARLISIIFSPILIPTYAIGLAVTFSEIFVVIPAATRLITIAVIFVTTGLLPMTIIGGLGAMKLVKNLSLSDQSDRTVPYALTSVLYIVAVVYLWMVRAPGWLVAFMGGASLALIIVAIVNRWWKISAHGAGMGGLVAIVFLLAIRFPMPAVMLPIVMAAVIMTGLVAVARLVLQAHSAGQVYAGIATGFFSVFLLSLLNANI